MALPDDGNRYELVNGELVNMGNAGLKHGYYATLVGSLLSNFVRAQRLGIILDSSTAFTMKSGNKRSPDASFLSKARLKAGGGLIKGFFVGAPDLAVEVLSPGNTVEEIHDKIVEYFDSGSQLVWVIHPDEQYVLVYRHPQPSRLLLNTDSLEGEDVIPGFHLPLAELFKELDF
ncbi:MAG: Uma2 family endonuclease [Gloeomargaritaceae cyanobacterium C42_A2020_066]|nr:Uma2 family endonuclease [Gloeomargaritaceae cyanobacterium C42_A2020_066]